MQQGCKTSESEFLCERYDTKSSKNSACKGPDWIRSRRVVGAVTTTRGESVTRNTISSFGETPILVATALTKLWRLSHARPNLGV
jgi:hypothetical protein